jgi:hypothetical protein
MSKEDRNPVGAALYHRGPQRKGIRVVTLPELQSITEGTRAQETTIMLSVNNP